MWLCHVVFCLQMSFLLLLALTECVVVVHPVPVCRISEFPCKNNKCIRLDRYCNKVNDCGDKSDEPPFCTGTILWNERANLLNTFLWLFPLSNSVSFEYVRRFCALPRWDLKLRSIQKWFFFLPLGLLSSHSSGFVPIKQSFIAESLRAVSAIWKGSHYFRCMWKTKGAKTEIHTKVNSTFYFCFLYTMA